MTWEIPVYVMISGRFFLDPVREMPGSKLLKAIRRLLFAFFFWNVIYGVFYFVTDAYGNLNWKGILSQTLIGPYHFWYLYMIVGLYLITPFLRKITEDKKLSEYFIILFFFFSFLTKYAVALPFIGSTLGGMLDSVGMKFVLGYSGYFVLGYYLYKYPLPIQWERVLYFCGAVLLLLGASANSVCSAKEGIYTERFTGYTNPNTIITATAIYTLFVRRVGKKHFSKKSTYLISVLSECSFGVYLIHALTLDVFAAVGLKPTVLHPLLAMPLITLLTLAVTVVIVMMLRKIPKVGRKIT